MSEVNDFIGGKLSKYANSVKPAMLKDAELMSSIGVASEDDLKNFLYISQHIKTIAEDISNVEFNKDSLDKFIKNVYLNKDSYPIDTIFNFYKAVSNVLDKFGYPTGFGGASVNPPRNIAKWIQAMKEIYYNVHRGLSTQEAFELIARDWDELERRDFVNWKRFYDGNNHMKYKTAQYYQPDGGAPMIPMSHLKAPNIPGMPNMDRVVQEDPDLQRKKEINKKLKAIVARLQAAEKLATDPELRSELKSVLDIGLAKWLEILHSLKRSIQTIPMKSAKSSIYEDLIIREGNRLEYFGYPKSGLFLKKIAQTAESTPPVTEEEPMEIPQPDLTVGEPEEENSDDAAMKELLERMNHSYYYDDENESDDLRPKTAQMMQLPDQEEVHENLEEPIEEDLSMQPPDPLIEEEPLESEEESLITKDLPSNDDLDIGEVSINGVISDLESVADILRHRELPRKLAIVDLKMDMLGVAGFFPSLGEAHRSALESNQYMATRIDDIISKLRSGVKPTKNLNLASEPKDSGNEMVEQVKNNLENQEQLDLAKKEKKKQLVQEEKKPAPQIPELEKAIEVEQAPALPIQ